MGIKAEDLLRIAIVIALGIAIYILISKIIKKRVNKEQILYKKYMLHLVRLIVLILCAIDVMRVIDPGIDISDLLFKGSALVVAIVGFAAQPAISDLIGGLLISINKPFEIGDRIIIEGEQPGIVEDITLRHTVIRIYDDIRIIVPNSDLNTKTVTNTSYKNTERRGIHMRFAVSYDTDVSRAMEVIRDCVAESPYTLSVTENGMTQDSGPVYFLEFADSALMLDTTIWVTRTTSSYVAITDINLRVNNAFKKNGIEIPYNYVNVVQFEGKKVDIEDLPDRQVSSRPSKRQYRTNTLKYNMNKSNIEDAVGLAKAFSKRQRLGRSDSAKLELLTEEAVGIVTSVSESENINLWIDGTGLKYRIHLTFASLVGTEEYKRLVNLSSKGRNEAVTGLAGKIREIMAVGLTSASTRDKEEYKWSLKEASLSEDEIRENIVTVIADDIKVTVTKEKVEFLVIKSAEGK